MSCKNVCKLCPRLIISQAVTFAGGVLTVNLPAGAYVNSGKYCLVIAQTIPTTATITAPVEITIGDGTATYPLVDSCCRPVTACGIRTRTKYATRVVTDATGGTFRLLGKPCCSPSYALTAIDGTDAVEGGAAG